ncbi:hypothetical protein GGS23DRAFT_168646 [Durotheca rogersii]|uniref:uncharacterized protein n=1 Tax=Durotheca rogersii TaxID=419775 RepID=UPI00221E6204|nr:uncharacterized protein GGS23DRAFT_168646 [Durotheca rogersii]KAI5867278.1 hypothetical protein GGS23DRAFT_168646 [Durotheca rogersii]
MRTLRAGLKFLRKLWPRKTRAVVTGAVPFDTAAAPEANKEAQPSSNQYQSPTPVPPHLEECPICHDPVGIANPEGIIESWTKLHCGHKFGTHCIQTWLQESIDRDERANPTCPICRTTAKHPCGHLISPLPLFSSMSFADSYDWRLSRPPPAFAPLRRRRRLTRRPDHPLRPPAPPRRAAQTVGECRTCVANAEIRARLRRASVGHEHYRQQEEQQQQREQEHERRRRQRRQNTDESTASTGTARSTAAAIKSLIPSRKRSASSRVRTTIVDMDEGGPSRSSQRHPSQAGFGVLCDATSRMQISPTTTSEMSAMLRSESLDEGYDRRLSL